MKLATVWYLTWTASYLAIFFKAIYQGIKWHFCLWNWIKAGDLQGLSCNATTGSSPNISSALLHDSNWNQGTFSYTVTKKLLLFGLFCFGSTPPPRDLCNFSRRSRLFALGRRRERIYTQNKSSMLGFGSVHSPHEHLYGSAVSVERVIMLGRALGCFDKSKLVGRERESSHCSILPFKYQLSFLQPWKIYQINSPLSPCSVLICPLVPHKKCN